MPGPFHITPAQLVRLVGLPDAPVIIDVRTPDDFAADPCDVPGALHWAHSDADALAAGLKADRVVVVCQRGKKLSEGVAAMLRLHGSAAEVLDGGFAAWRAAGYWAVPANLVPPNGLWVTRHRPKIDRIACPWLIRRFIDPRARFQFVSPSEVDSVAANFNATPFDVEGARFSHRGDHCSFDALLDDFDLHHPALDRMALVIRAADTDRHDLSPQAAGLLALSVGLSRQFRDDLSQLEAGMVLYDALYRWARDGSDEGHDWPATRGQE